MPKGKPGKADRRKLSKYVIVLQPDHPRSIMDGYVFEHILVAEEKLGRPIGLDEVVHHIDGDGLNNSPDNLQVMTRGEHMKEHAPGKGTRFKTKHKLDPDEVLKLYTELKSTARVAERYGCSEITVRRLLTKKLGRPLKRGLKKQV